MKKDTAYLLLSPGIVTEEAAERPRFPPHIADQAMRRSLVHHPRPAGPHTLYDPFCGVGVFLTTATALERGRLSVVFGSDIDAGVVAQAQRNLTLCDPAAISALETDLIAHPEHAVGGQTAARLKEFGEMLRQYGCTSPVPGTFFIHDALQPVPETTIAPESVSLVLSDPPYGQQTPLVDAGHDVTDEHVIAAGYTRFLGALRPSLQDGAVVALVCDRRETIRDIVAAAPDYMHRESRRASGLKRNFRQIHILSAS